MTKHQKKYLAPIVIVTFLVAYYLGVVFFLLTMKLPFIFNVLAMVFTLLLTGALLYVLVERIREINKGEEDDLGKY